MTKIVSNIQSVLKVSLKHVSKQGVVSVLTTQYVGVKKVKKSDVITAFSKINSSGFNPSLFGMDSPGPSFVWEAGMPDDLLCEVESFDLIKSVDENLPVSGKDLNLILNYLRYGGDPFYEERSQSALRNRINELQSRRTDENIQFLVGEVDEQGKLKNLCTYGDQPKVVLFLIDPFAQDSQNHYAYPDSNGNAVFGTFKQSKVDDQKVGWFNVVTDFSGVDNSSDFCLDGTSLYDISCGPEDVVHIEGRVENELLPKLCDTMNSFDWDKYM
ncbi:hypothetical protein [Vibrio harveyi]|uniref:hypothetical protein n=2 Tax=Vibrio harveyi group TaxID=717610 RepID=UPI003D734A84